VEYKVNVFKAESIMKLEGIVPVKELDLNLRTCNAINPPNSGGRDPMREFPLRSRYESLVREESVEGRLPVKQLFQIEIDWNFVNSPKKEGREPINELPLMSRSVRLVSVESVEGRVPVIRLPRNSPESLMKPPRKEGIGPIKELAPRWR
jgi:hypothetical protein